MKVLHTIRQGQIGGGETHVLDLVASLNPQKYASLVLAFTDGEMVRRLSDKGVECMVIPTTRPFDWKVWKKVENLMREKEVDLVHAHGTRACSNTFKAANRLKLPLAYTIHGWSFHPDQKPWVRKLREWGEWFLVRKTSLNISVSKSNNQDGVERLQMPHSRVVNYGVDLKRFDPDQNFTLNRAELELPEDKFLFGMVARLTKQKDPFTFIKAAAQLKGQDVHFLIVGGGELEQDCYKLVQETGMVDQFTFLPFRTDVPAILNLLDVYCLPSLWEGLPIGILEAMAMRKTIIATPVNGTQEVISDGETGYLFPAYQYEMMAQRMDHCLNKLQEARQVGANARKIIEEKFSLPVMAQNVEEVYQELLPGQK